MAGGAERVLCLLASALVQRGHQVTILTFDASNQEPFYEIDPRIQLIRLGIGNVARPARMLETGVRVLALRKNVISHCPDVVIGFNPSIFLLLGLALWGSGIRVVGSEHIVPDHFKKRPIQYAAYILFSNFVHKITVLSENIRDTYPRIIRRRMVSIQNPVLHIVSPRTDDQLLGRSNVILNVGRLVAQKNQEALIRAFAIISPYHPHWRLVIFGEGMLRNKLEALVVELGMLGRVSLPGITKDIEAEYRQADIFALSSDYESFGLVLVEAMQHAKPVIAFADCPGARDIIMNNINGVLVNPGQDRVSALAEGLENLIKDPERCAQLGKEAQVMVLETFKPELVYDKWETLLHDVANGH